MFFWCCPRKKKHKQIQQLHQPLIEQQKQQILVSQKQTSKSKVINIQQQNAKSQKKSYDDARSQPQYQKDKGINKLYERANKTESKANIQNIGFPPSFQKNQGSKLFSPRQKSIGSSKKSHLWKQQLKSDLIYLDSSNSEYIYMSYRLAKNQQSKQYSNGLAYFLSKSQDKLHIIVGKHSMFHSKLPTINKYMHNLMNIIIVNQGASITDHSLGLAQAILMQSVKNLRWNGVNSLVIMADTLHTYAQVKQYFRGVVRNLGLQELKKSTFLFPSFMTLQQISKLLFPCYKQFVLNSTVQKASLDLAFDMELIEGSNLDSCIIIKCRTQQAKQNSSIYDHLKLSIIFFAKQLVQLNQKVYIDFYVQVRQKTLQQFCDMKQFYRRNPLQLRHKIKQIRDIELKAFADLESSPPLKQISSQQSGYYYVIPNKVREDIGRIYNIAELQKKQVDTPVKKEWDDDATADDFKTSKISKLDMVAKQELDQIDLEMGFGNVSDDDTDFKTEQYNHNEIIIKMEQNQSYTRLKKSDQNKTFSPSSQPQNQNQQKQKQIIKQKQSNRCDRNRRYQSYS